MPGQITKRVSTRTHEVSWQVRVRIGAKPNGKPLEVVKSFKLQRDAKSFLNKLLQDRANGTAVAQAKMTLNVYLDHWLEASVKQGVRTQTAESYRDVLDRYVRPGLGARRVDQLTALAIQRHLQALGERVTTRRVQDSATGKLKKVERRLSPRTIRYAYSVLSAALKQAVKWRIIPHNPATDVEVPRQPRREMQALGKDQAVEFLEAVRGTKHEVLFTLALATGMRPGEYLALKWSDIDLDRGMVTVQRTLVRTKGGWHFGEPKTSRARRTLPIPSTVTAMFRQHRVSQLEQRMKVADAWEDNGLVFTNEIGQPLERHNLLNRHFKPLLKAAALPVTLRLYDLRHSAATLLLTAGIHPKVASERLGHSSIVMTLDTYSHVQPDMQKEASDKMEELLFGK